MRLVYLGSPSEAVAPLCYLCEQIATQSSPHELVAVVSRPAQIRGRGRRQQKEDPPVAAWAKERGLLTLQPEKARDPEFLRSLRELQPDLMITCAYGQILSEDFLSIPRRGTINIHPSALPSYRGASPVPAVLLAGACSTAVSILFTVRALDAGHIIIQKPFDIFPDETAGELTRRLFELSGPLLMESLALLSDEQFTGNAQDENLVTVCGKITKDMGKVNWNSPVNDIYNRYRAFQPWPGSFTELNGVRVVIEKMLPERAGIELLPEKAPGTVLFDPVRKFLRVRAGDGWIRIDSLKPEGRKLMDAVAYWNGYGNGRDLRFQ
ncbi:MAG: methionyl-tRNA formyltransferase [Deltaproteobacteria bacterium]|nr:methionyl-tRNA formyltransferase [Deltaproteobacteria bacterium]